MGKVENAGSQHFLLFPLCFQMGLYLRFVKPTDYFGAGLC